MLTEAGSGGEMPEIARKAVYPMCAHVGVGINSQRN